MFAATAVTVQFAVLGRSEPGSSVIELVPEPLTENVCAPPQLIVNELVVTSTGSLKLTVMVDVADLVGDNLHRADRALGQVARRVERDRRAGRAADAEALGRAGRAVERE